jgi:hypothetical protein
MTTASAEGRPAGGWRGQADRLTRWAGHYQLYFLAAAVVLGVADTADAYNSGVLDYATEAAMFAWVAAVSCDVLRHQTRLCERCITESPVLNPAAAVKRWRWALWWEHHRILRALPSMLLLALIFGGTAITAGQHNGGRLPWQLTGYAVLLPVVGVIWFVTEKHRRLRPWCPYCRRWDDGGAHEAAPVLPETPVSR